MNIKLRDFTKIIFVNTFFFTMLIGIIEITFSKYFSTSPALDIPETKFDVSKVIDTTNIEFQKEKTNSKYSRDKNGYRPYNQKTLDKGLILTIGGSTTDQLYVDDSKTWQRILESEKGLSVLNGGVDGQSSYGYLIAIEKWHSKVLKENNVQHLIFFTGVNDVRLSKEFNTSIKNFYDSPSRSRLLFISRSTKCYRIFYFSRRV